MMRARASPPRTRAPSRSRACAPGPRATTRFLDRREFVFGALKPGREEDLEGAGEAARRTSPRRRDDVTVRFFDDQGALPETLVDRAELRGAAPARLRLQLAGAGRLRRRATATASPSAARTSTLVLDVTNAGTGKALDSFAQIKNAARPEHLHREGPLQAGRARPGRDQDRALPARGEEGLQGRHLPAEAGDHRRAAGGVRHREAELPVDRQAGPPVEARKGNVRVETGAPVLARPDAGRR